MSSDSFAVIGDPVVHSLSPRMHAAAFAAAGLDASYERLHVAPADLAGAVVMLRRQGYRGFNVTVPHKRAVMSFLDRVDPVAARVGAVNTVARDGCEFVGYNTDVEGFAAALDRLVGRDWRGHALVFGAGGAARAVVAALLSRSSVVTISNRTAIAADGVAADFGPGVRVARTTRECAGAVYDAELVVNATSLGLGDLADRSPLDGGARFRPGTSAIDLVYGRMTPFMTAARESGCRVQGGIEMLVQQGAAAFRIWTGVEPDIEAMRTACETEPAEVGR